MTDFEPHLFSNDSLDDIDSFIRANESNTESNEFDELNRRLEETLGLSMRDVQPEANEEPEKLETLPEEEPEKDAEKDAETEEVLESDEGVKLNDEDGEEDALTDIASLFSEIDFNTLEVSLPFVCSFSVHLFFTIFSWCLCSERKGMGTEIVNFRKCSTSFSTGFLF